MAQAEKILTYGQGPVAGLSGRGPEGKALKVGDGECHVAEHPAGDPPGRMRGRAREHGVPWSCHTPRHVQHGDGPLAASREHHLETT